jgi:nicotinate-nucleotide adenylyltransferase
LRLGILGGAFNPPHLGHLVCAQEAVSQLSLDRVDFMPTANPPHREIDQDPGAQTRLDLCEAAVSDDERFTVSRMELDREGPSYTVDTLRALHEQSPDDELFLLLGGDQAAALPDWHEPEEVLRLATVAAVERAGFSRNGIGITIGRLAGAERVVFLDMPAIQVSSTLIRRRLGAGKPIRYLVPDAVGAMIADKGLYEAPAPAPAA